MAGFLLPDHIDEELEAFTVAGQAISQIGHDAVTGAVTWELAPGRPLPPDAGPLAGLDAHARITGEIAAGPGDGRRAGPGVGPAAGRQRPCRPCSPAIDTTLWTNGRRHVRSWAGPRDRRDHL